MEFKEYSYEDLEVFIKGVTNNESLYKKRCLRCLLESSEFRDIEYNGYMVYEGSSLVGRCIIWRVVNEKYNRENPRNQKETCQRLRISYIGFLDCEDNQEVFDYLLNGIEDRKERRVTGPIDFFDSIDVGVSENDSYDYPSYYGKLFKNYKDTIYKSKKFEEIGRTKYYYSRYNVELYTNVRNYNSAIELKTDTNVNSIINLMYRLADRSEFIHISNLSKYYSSIRNCHSIYRAFLTELKRDKKLKMYESDELAYLLTSCDGTDVTVWGMSGVTSKYMNDTVVAFLKEMLKEGCNVIWKCSVPIKVPYTGVLERNSFYSIEFSNWVSYNDSVLYR